MLRYPGLGPLATTNPEIQAIGIWARYLGLGTLAWVPLVTSMFFHIWIAYRS